MSNTRKTDYLIVPTPGNGQSDCFYNAIMLGVIHDVLADKLDEESETGQIIQQVVLPRMAEELKKLTGFTFNFEGLSLKKSILHLLNALSLKTSQPILHTSEAISALQKSHVQALLKDVCAPVLRQITYEGAGFPVVISAVKTVFEVEFNAYLKSSYPFDLCLEEDEHTAAFFQKDEEFRDLPDDFKTTLHTAWDEKYAEVHALQPEVPVDLVKAFKEWWDANVTAVCIQYFSLKAKSNTLAGLPEQVALKSQLACQIEVFNRSGENSCPLYTNLASHQDDHVFMLDASQPYHFNAVVEKTETGTALANHMNELVQGAGLSEPDYNWQEVEQEVLPLNTAIEDSIAQTKLVITQIETTCPGWKNNLSKTEIDTIEAAKKGYKQARIFSTPAETEDLELAIRLQNEEISLFNKRFNR